MLIGRYGIEVAFYLLSRGSGVVDPVCEIAESLFVELYCPGTHSHRLARLNEQAEVLPSFAVGLGVLTEDIQKSG
jgi:hypothetical protein